MIGFFLLDTTKSIMTKCDDRIKRILFEFSKLLPKMYIVIEKPALLIELNVNIAIDGFGKKIET